MAANFSELGFEQSRRHSLIWGVVSTVLVLALAFLLPERFPNYALPVGYTVALRQIATQLQSAAFKNHLDGGGSKHSSWRAAGIGVSFLAGMTILLFAVVSLIPEQFLPG